jgi:hypothetical protein
VPNARPNSMKRSKFNLIGISIAILSTIGLMLDKNDTIILPISALLIILLMIVNLLTTRRMIKTGKYLKIGSNKKDSIRDSILMSILGLIWLFLGIFQTKSNIHYLGIDINCYIGFLFISSSFLKYDNYVIIIRDKDVSFIDFATWEISKIEKVILKNSAITFIKKEQKKHYALNDPTKHETIKIFLKNKFKDKLLVEN